jgi:hypothetical protein
MQTVTHGSGNGEDRKLVSDAVVLWRCLGNVDFFVQANIPEFFSSHTN